MKHPFISGLDSRMATMAQACTQCGECVRACPMPATAGQTLHEPDVVAGGMLDWLRHDGTEDGASVHAGRGRALDWANLCAGSGACIDACPEALNPRFMVAMVRQASKRTKALKDRRAHGRAMFKDMSRGLRVLTRMQLAPALLERFSSANASADQVVPDLVFYTGCNLLKTPHIGLLCLDVLDALEVTYDVQGGPQSCCGVFQTRSGDDENALRQGIRTLDRFAATKTARVLSWCPTCEIQFRETTLPVRAQHLQVGPIEAQPSTGFDMTMFPLYLVERLDELKPLLRYPVNKRVALHEHPGSPGVTEAVVQLLSSIPGLEVVELGLPRVGYTLGSLGTVPHKRKQLIAERLAATEAAGATTLAGVFHSDHRELAAHEGQWPFEIVNYMELLGEAMGIVREDSFKRLKVMQDADAIIADCSALIEAHRLDLDEVREIVVKDLLGEQYLPIPRAQHDAALQPA